MSKSHPVSPEGEKLQKVLARAGLGSRRQMEQWIVAGRVSIDGTRATLGDRVGSRQAIRVDGRLLSSARQSTKRRVLIYHKPEGEICTRSDPAGRPTVFAHLPRLGKGRWVGIGRLDINTSGLMLFTTDGELANRLMHPRYRIQREYAVRVHGQVDHEMLGRLQQGIELEDGPAAFETITDAGGEGRNHWYHVTLREGRHREVRRMWEAAGVVVSRLIRVRFGSVKLPRRCRVGRWQELTPEEIRPLITLVGITDSTEGKRGRR